MRAYFCHIQHDIKYNVPELYSKGIFENYFKLLISIHIILTKIVEFRILFYVNGDTYINHLNIIVGKTGIGLWRFAEQKKTRGSPV